MDFFASHYSFMTLCIVAIASFVFGRWSKGAPVRQHDAIDDSQRYARQHSVDDDVDRLSPSMRSEIDTLLARRKVIAAVKVARRELNIGLKEAKDVIDQIRTSH